MPCFWLCVKQKQSQRLKNSHHLQRNNWYKQRKHWLSKSQCASSVIIKPQSVGYLIGYLYAILQQPQMSQLQKPPQTAKTKGLYLVLVMITDTSCDLTNKYSRVEYSAFWKHQYVWICDEPAVADHGCAVLFCLEQDYPNLCSKVKTAVRYPREGAKRTMLLHFV